MRGTPIGSAPSRGRAGRGAATSRPAAGRRRRPSPDRPRPRPPGRARAGWHRRSGLRAAPGRDGCPARPACSPTRACSASAPPRPWRHRATKDPSRSRPGASSRRRRRRRAWRRTAAPQQKRSGPSSDSTGSTMRGSRTIASSQVKSRCGFWLFRPLRKSARARSGRRARQLRRRQDARSGWTMPSGDRSRPGAGVSIAGITSLRRGMRIWASDFIDKSQFRM